LANDIAFARLRAPQISLEEKDAKASPTAIEQPDLFVKDLRESFRSAR
jgi:hypothetical protein